MMFIVLGSAAINIVLNFLLVPPLGVYGAAYATVLSFSIFFGIKYWYAKKCYFIDYNWNGMGKGLLVAVPIVSVVYFTNMNIIFSLFAKLFVVACLSLFLYIRFGTKI